MAFLSSENQAELKQIFEQLVGEVRLEFFTQHESPIILPGNDCPTCNDARMLLEEVVALSDKLHLEIHEVQLDGEVAREHHIDRLPALVMSADGVKGKVRYFGLPSGYEFSVLIGSLVEVSKTEADLSEETVEALNDVDKDLHIQVFVTPTWPHCPDVARLAHKMAIANEHVVADVVEVSEFPDLARRYSVRGVPKTVINDSVEFVGNVPEPMFVENLQRALAN